MEKQKIKIFKEILSLFSKDLPVDYMFDEILIVGRDLLIIDHFGPKRDEIALKNDAVKLILALRHNDSVNKNEAIKGKKSIIFLNENDTLFDIIYQFGSYYFLMNQTKHSIKEIFEWFENNNKKSLTIGYLNSFEKVMDVVIIKHLYELYPESKISCKME